jgi:hypothetical protein
MPLVYKFFLLQNISRLLTFLLSRKPPNALLAREQWAQDQNFRQPRDNANVKNKDGNALKNITTICNISRTAPAEVAKDKPEYKI